MFGRSGQMFPNPRIPKGVGNIYYEVELGVVIGRRIFNISEESALESVAGYFLAFDLTAKDLLRTVYHDAMYEDEFTGSTQSDSGCCCRAPGCGGRGGVSALACWFLSVLILLGLAVSIILTVFFVFRSRTYISKPIDMSTSSSGEDITTLSSIVNDLDLTFNGNSTPTRTSVSVTRQPLPPTRGDNNRYEESSSEVHNFMVPSPTSMRPWPNGTPLATATTTRRPRVSPYPSQQPAISPVINYKSVVLQTQNLPGSHSSPSTSTMSSTSRKVYNDLIRSSTPHNYGSPSPTAPVRSSTKAQELLDLQSSLSTTTSRSAMIKLIVDTMNRLRDADMQASIEDTVFPPSLSKDVVEKLKALNRNKNKKKYQHAQGNRKYDKVDADGDGDDEDSARESDGSDGDGDENLEKLIATIIASGSSSAEKRRRVGQEHEQADAEGSPSPDRDYFDDFIGIGLSTKKKSSKEDFRTTTTSTTSSTSTSTAVPHQASRGDLLTRIIKNLAPRFKSKTEKPSTGSSSSPSGASASSEKRMRWSSISSTSPSTSTSVTSTSTTSQPNPNVIIITPTVILPGTNSHAHGHADARGSGERRRTNGLEIVKAPTLAWSPSRQEVGQEQNSDEQEMLDILVSSQDSKTMITKQTEDGIVTSVILPPWYVNDTYDEGYHSSTSSSPSPNSNSDSGSKGENSTIIIYPNDDSREVTTTYSPPSLGNFFRNLLFGNKNADEDGSRVSSTKKPTYLEDKRDSFTTKPQIIRRRMKSTTERTTSASDSTSSSPVPAVTIPDFRRMPTTEDTPTPAHEGFHQVSSDGKTNIYGYYPENDEDEIMHYSDSKRIPIPNRDRDTVETIDDDDSGGDSGANTREKTPTAVIDIEYDRKIRPHIIVDNSSEDENEDEIENMDNAQSQSQSHHNEGDRHLYGEGGYAIGQSYGYDPLAGASSIRPQILPAPPEMTSTKPGLGSVPPTGGGIRHPVSMLTGKDDAVVQSGKSDAEKDKNAATPAMDQISTPSVLSIDYDLIPVGIHMNGSSTEAAEIGRQPIQQLAEDLYPFPQIVKPSPAASQEVLESSYERTQRQKVAKVKPTSTESSQESDEVTTRRNVYEVYAVKYTTTPRSNSVDQSPSNKKGKTKNKNSSKAAQTSSEEAKNNFEAPELISFHSNRLSFSQPLTTGGFSPLDNQGVEAWRPVRENAIRQVRTSTPAAPGTQRQVVKRPVKRPDTMKQPSEGSNGSERNALAQSTLWFQTTEAPPSLSPPPQKPSKLPIRPSQPIPPPPTPPMQQHQHPPHGPPHNMHYFTANPHDHVYHHPNANGNNVHLQIDRSKYLHRPAPPPILMRRTPQQQHGHGHGAVPPFVDMPLPSRKVSTPNYPPQYLSNQQQLLRQQQQLHQHMMKLKAQNQHGHHAPTQRQHQSPHLHNRLAGNGNINWPAAAPSNEFESNQPDHFQNSQDRRQG